MDVKANLERLGLALPAAPEPAGSYLPAVRSGPLLFVSGQLPIIDGKLMAAGTVPSAVDLDTATQAAARCALNALAIVAGHLEGDWSRLRRVVRIGVFVASDAGFTQQPQVANGASDLLAQLLGERGRHARAAVGASALPLGAPVELEMVVEVADAEGHLE